PRPAAGAAAAFAEISAAVVRSVLGEWAGPTRLPPMDVPAILRRQLGDRLAPGSPLHRLAAAHPGPTVTTEGEDHPLPNPFALVRDAGRSAGVWLPTFVGRAHGDLHVENILIPTAWRDAGAAFQLIDLSRYAPDAVLTRDPTHLVLHVLARMLVELSPNQRTATIDLLLDPDLDGAILPQWLWLFIGQVRSAGEEWARAAGLVEQWRDQLPLSLLACALTCYGRASTREEDRGWFLRLAANAAAAFLDQHNLDQHSVHNLDQHSVAEPAQKHSGSEQTGHERFDPDSHPVDSDREQRPDANEPGHASPEPVVADGADGFPVDVVLSHSRTDAGWASWIGWHLEAAGWHVLPYPDLDDPGERFDPDEPPRPDERGEQPMAISLAGAVAQVPWTLVVLSPAYLGEVAGSAEWQEALPAESAAYGTRLVTIRIKRCDPPDWLDLVESVDLVGLGEDEARATLVDRLTALRDGDRTAGLPPR
ncbi:toll/interleukin-1 receptor domain-containing protein, partial [Frankia gtarii]|uniref:toll/interleukin-1 receptor domain-containing protein n=1 Tax=Frankia gtarii TaxID=2950102 RepID=UPI0021C108EF